MARIVFGAGSSHSPLLTLPSSAWANRAADDLRNPRLNLSDGRFVSYDELLAERGARHAADMAPDRLTAQDAACQAALDRLADDLAAADPDVVIIVGDDQEELFGATNQPAFSVYFGDEVVMNDKFGRPENPQWIKDVAKGYMMDTFNRHPGARSFGLALVEGLLDRGVDVSTASGVQDPAKAGFGHAFGFIIARLFRGRKWPVLPLLLNTYFPPNVIRPSRSHDIGRAVRDVIEAMPGDARVAIIASGGLSHFVTDETLDQRVLAGFAPGGTEALRSIPMDALKSGSSEILNWVLTAGAIGHLTQRWQVYEPIYRTPAGTGIGMAFAVWQ